jgi:probable rRNA maturation factor
LNIKFFYDKVNFRVKGSGEIKAFLEKVITDERKSAGDLSFIFTRDEVMLGMNKEFLKHNYHTDVIAFDNCSKGIVSGEVYISVEALRRNAKLYNVLLSEELMRVLIHGTLHLCGYLDKDDKSEDHMFKRQEQLVKKFGKDKGNGF